MAEIVAHERGISERLQEGEQSIGCPIAVWVLAPEGCGARESLLSSGGGESVDHGAPWLAALHRRLMQDWRLPVGRLAWADSS
jgi:hypothetical protein